MKRADDRPILPENTKSIYVKASRSPLGEHCMRNLRGGYAFLQELFFWNVGGMIRRPIDGCQRSGTDLTEPPRKAVVNRNLRAHRATAALLPALRTFDFPEAAPLQVKAKIRSLFYGAAKPCLYCLFLFLKSMIRQGFEGNKKSPEPFPEQGMM